MYKMFMKHQWESCSGLGPLYKIPPYAGTTFSKHKTNMKLETPIPKGLNNTYTTCSFNLLTILGHPSVFFSWLFSGILQPSRIIQRLKWSWMIQVTSIECLVVSGWKLGCESPVGKLEMTYLVAAAFQKRQGCLRSMLGRLLWSRWKEVTESAQITEQGNG